MTPELVNPFVDIYQNISSNALPIGIASYGLNNTLNNSIKTYQINTSEVVGIANISSIRAYNAMPLNMSKYGASLQLNVMMAGYNTNGKELTYWLQDMVRFNTSSNTFYIIDNIWNRSLPNLNMTKVYGNGNLSIFNHIKFYSFSFPNYTMNYSLPIFIKLMIRTTGNKISFGYQIIKNNYCDYYPNSFTCESLYFNATQLYFNTTSQFEIFYDNVTIPNLSNYSILVTPYYHTPAMRINSSSYYGDNYYDAELIFGGEGNGENTTFTSMNATLQLFYNQNGTLTTFPTYYTFGRDTSEGTYNLYTIIKNGIGYVAIGSLNPLVNINSDYNLTYLQNKSAFK